jgi:hypothetical protein
VGRNNAWLRRKLAVQKRLDVKSELRYWAESGFFFSRRSKRMVFAQLSTSSDAWRKWSAVIPKPILLDFQLHSARSEGIGEGGGFLALITAKDTMAIYGST